MLKPGPKVGSVHKRRRMENPLTRKSSQPSPSTAGNPVTREELPSSPRSPPQIIGHEDESLYSKHIQAVSDLCHMTNEDPSPATADILSPTNTALASQDVLTAACDALGVSQDSIEQMIETFFRTFTPFRLFREPQFLSKLAQLPSVVQVKALLAPICAFACKDATLLFQQNPDRSKASDFADLAIKFVDEAIAQCGDEAPPLCVLQALILTTHWVIVRGVRGRAWRYVGLCVRVAFELGLHITDVDVRPEAYSRSPEKWCEEEERRRAYWAVWDMDQFASHIKHIPITIDWAQYEVCLPVEDDRWFDGRPQRSCALAGDLINRSKDLHATGNKSPRAWFIVIASLNAEANELAYPQEKIHRRSRERVLAIADRRQALFNAIQLSLILLPQELRFHGQHLDFGTHTMGLERIPSVLHLHSSIYLIALLPETSKIIALRPYVFEAYLRKLLTKAQSSGTRGEEQELSEMQEESARKVEQCYKAADAILNIVMNCHESHYKYVSPYVAHVSWLAATVPLLQQELVEDDSQKLVIRSRFEILKATVSRFLDYWEMSQVPKQNLDLLELRLKQFSAASKCLKPRDAAADATADAAAQKQRPQLGERSQGGYIAQSTNSDWLSESEENVAPDRPGNFGHYHNQPDDYRPSRNANLPESALSGTSQALPPDMRPEGSNFMQPSHWHELHSQFNTAFPLRDASLDSWFETGIQQAPNASTDSDPSNWLSLFNNVEVNEELTDWFGRFSGWDPAEF
ncbi:uncharacterized protein A1O9_02233 [Exophiala aquamarina CBS 119918]|uniref:Xylanolytic transcriptional activator regulatory domain-containing protein n=1 Tax=Exophiala aquamarina CBS 119918 TaxID=1182545 RepID=A0A072PLP2_9EURO|nr:uncharacterized protein A1O9_02233 [Exophiala aquamarina CBS 119918]KEF60672.1 hypothetical protein A1O9_02233 [Exophiala aquamarina CBS 119918]